MNISEQFIVQSQLVGNNALQNSTQIPIPTINPTNTTPKEAVTAVSQLGPNLSVAQAQQTALANSGQLQPTVTNIFDKSNPSSAIQSSAQLLESENNDSSASKANKVENQITNNGENNLEELIKTPTDAGELVIYDLLFKDLKPRLKELQAEITKAMNAAEAKENAIATKRSAFKGKKIRHKDVLANDGEDPVLKMVRGKLRSAAYGSGRKVDWDSMFRKYDKSGDGVLDLSEFLILVRKSLKINPVTLKDREIRQLFKHLDDDNSGEISVGELVGFVDKTNTKKKIDLNPHLAASAQKVRRLTAGVIKMKAAVGEKDTDKVTEQSKTANETANETATETVT